MSAEERAKLLAQPIHIRCLQERRYGGLSWGGVRRPTDQNIGMPSHRLGLDWDDGDPQVITRGDEG